MNGKVAYDIFRLFDMSEKNEGQIMDIMIKSQYAKEACALGITLLKAENNIFNIMKKTGYYKDVCQAGLKTLKMGEKTENQILAITNRVKEDDREETIKKLCIPYLKLEKKKEYQILNLLQKTNYDYTLREALITALKLESKTDEQLLSIMEISNFQENVCAAGIKYFKEEEHVLTLMERPKTPDFVIEAGAPNLKWEGKTDEQILESLRRAHYQSAVCAAGIVFLRDEYSIITVMKNYGFYSDVCDIGIPLLNLGQKTDDMLLNIMERMDYNWNICQPCIKLLNFEEKTESQIFGIIERTAYDKYVAMAGIVFLKSNIYHVYKIIQQCNYQVGVCIAGLKLLSETMILQTLEDSKFDPDICAEGINFITREDNIFFIMEKARYASRVCENGLKALKNLKAKK
ncbi:MAG: hypothetical protein WCK59_03765 [Candidatus Falkowbacteria bacterium]